MPTVIFYRMAGGARNVQTLSAAVIADLQADWEVYGNEILKIIREKFADLYFASIVKLAQIVRIEADVKTDTAKPKTVEEVLTQVAGPEGRRAFDASRARKRIAVAA